MLSNRSFNSLHGLFPQIWIGVDKGGYCLSNELHDIEIQPSLKPGVVVLPKTIFFLSKESGANCTQIYINRETENLSQTEELIHKLKSKFAYVVVLLYSLLQM